MRTLRAIVVLLLAQNPALWAADEAKRVVALIDYVGGDYRNAVQGGKVVNADEYAEMTEFSARSLDMFKKLKAAEGDKAGIEKDLHTLAGHIKNKTGDEAVPQLAQQIKGRLIKTYKISTFPKSLPTYAAGRTVFMENCAQCHGERGKGDGPGRPWMIPKEPPPANFTDAELMAGLSPFKVFNTATFGVDKTAMASF